MKKIGIEDIEVRQSIEVNIQKNDAVHYGKVLIENRKTLVYSNELALGNFDTHQTLFTQTLVKMLNLILLNKGILERFIWGGFEESCYSSYFFIEPALIKPFALKYGFTCNAIDGYDIFSRLKT